MNKSENNRYSMCRAVDSLLKEYSSVVQAIPALDEAGKEFAASIATIEEKDTLYTSVSKGASLQKQTIKKNLIAVAIRCAGVLFVYGNATGNKGISENANVTESDLRNYRETKLLQVSKKIFMYVSENQGALTKYGITPESVTEFNNVLNAYDSSVKANDSKHIESKTARKALCVAFLTTNEILKKKLDKLIDLVKPVNDKFFNLYHQARSVKDLGIRHLKEDPAKPVPVQA